MSSDSVAHSDTLATIARVGYVVKGVLYVVIGALAAMAAFGGGGQTSGSRGAIRTVAEAPGGPALLWVMAVGMGAYALWRFAEAFLDPDDKGGGASGAIKRIGYAASGLIHAALTVWVVRSLLSAGRGAGSGGAQDWTATLMAQPFGRWAVGVVGAAVIGYGLYQAYKAATVDFASKFKTEAMSETEKAVTKRAGQAGLGARGVVFGIVGVFLVQAALDADAQDARGLGGALDALAAQPFGPYLLGAVALGLAAFGVFSMINARYRAFS